MKHPRKLQLLFSAMLILALAVGSLPGSAKAYGAGTTYYVRPDGNDACDGKTNSAGVSGHCAKRSVAAAMDAAGDGDILMVNNDGREWYISLSSPITISKGVQFILGQNVFLNMEGGANGCFIVSASGVRISSEINQNGSCYARLNSETPATLIYVDAGVSNLIIDGLYLRGSGYSSDVGIYFAGAITNVQILNNYFTVFYYGRDIEFTSTPQGSVIDIKGNYFDENHDGSVLLPDDPKSSNIDLNYNSWGRAEGPRANDIAAMHGASSLNYTFALPIFDWGSHSSGTAMVGDDITVNYYLNAVRLTGADITLYFPSDKFEYVSSSTTGTDFNSNASIDTYNSQYGYLTFHGLTKFDSETQTYATLTKSNAFVFTATFHVISNGSTYIFTAWNKFTDNTAGPSNKISTSMVQTNFTISDQGPVTGTVSMQGRIARDSVYAELWQMVDQTLTSIKHASSSDQMTGNYSLLTVLDGSYKLSFTKPGYLDLTTTLNKSAYFVSGSRTIKALELKGGDADDNNIINILDAEAIGSDYGYTGGTYTSGKFTDINSSGLVDIYDLALMGGNYGLTSSTAYSGWSAQ